jgi:hypothetical protein
VSEQREYCKRFLRVYQLRIDQNLSRDIAWACAAAEAQRAHPLGGRELYEVEKWLRGRVKTLWRRCE